MKHILSFLFMCIVCSLHAIPQNNLLPQPQQITWGKQVFKSDKIELINTANIDCVPLQCTNLNFNIVDKASHKIEIRLVENIDEAAVNPDEAYRLNVTKKQITIEATNPKGIYWAFQTLKQLATTKGDKISIPTCNITDWPAFKIRGFMQDVGRSYISMEELKREIAILSQYKINVFHWHLTENQSWRLESKIFPMINDSINTTRMPGKYYTLKEAKELVAFCKAHNVLLLPEIDMPGHSAAFIRTFRHDMQSPEGMKILKLLIAEICETFDVPYLHIGTDEVQFTNPTFVPEMIAFVRSFGKKVISWNPGWNYKKGEIDMTHLWSYRGKAQPGIPAIDSKFHYLNHFDAFGDIVGLYNSKIANVTVGSDDIAGSIMAIWHDRVIVPEEKIMIQNSFYPTMLAFAERTWLGGGTEYFDKKGTILDTTPTETFTNFVDFERRMLFQKDKNFQGYPFAYVKQTNVNWHITDAFPNGGELTKAFPPEKALQESYAFEGKTYNVRKACGAGIYLRHVWGALIPSFYKDPKPDHTAYAYTWVYSPKAQETGMWVGFQNYGRSEMDLAPLPGKWDYRESMIWLNDKAIQPPTWTATHRNRSNEIPLGNENFEAREPMLVQLNKGWNKVLLKLPIGAFSTPEVRLQKWMFTAVFVSPDGKHATEGLIYSPEKIK